MTETTRWWRPSPATRRKNDTSVRLHPFVVGLSGAVESQLSASPSTSRSMGDPSVRPKTSLDWLLLQSLVASSVA